MTLALVLFGACVSRPGRVSAPLQQELKQTNTSPSGTATPAKAPNQTATPAADSATIAGSASTTADSVQGAKTQSLSADTSLLKSVSEKTDSLHTSAPDTTVSDAFADPVLSNGRDSTVFVLEESGRRVLLYGEAKIKYQDMELSADFIDYNFASGNVFAKGLVDTSGQVVGKPSFKQGSDEYKMDSMYFNFNSKKAKIYNVITTQGEGFLHGHSIKRMPDNSVNIMDGKYTTCDAECPHFYLALTKAKLTKKGSTVFGPAYLVLADVPIYFAGLPFGMLPKSKSNRQSGILIPSYGEENSRGFYLQNGGYYWAINDYVDLALTGDIYSLGSWRAAARSSYMWKYHFSGGFDISYSSTILGEKGSADYSKSSAFWINWNHQQDPKSTPNQTFSASVNFGSSSYKTYSERNLNDALTNNTQSSISYSKVWPGTPFSMNIAATHSQNTRDSMLTIGFPTMNFNMTRITPFKRKEAVGAERWYEKIGIPLSVSLQNSVTAKENEYADMNGLMKKMKNGLRYNTSLSIPFNLKTINISPSISYNGRVYLNEIEKTWDAANERVVTDTIYGLSHSYEFSTALSASTQIYGMFLFKPNRKIQAIRHMMTPSVSVSWRPDFGKEFWGFYKEVQINRAGDKQKYALHEQGIYGASGRGQNASLSLSLGNTVEVKVKSVDTTGANATKKIKLLEGLNFSTSYNMLADSLGWAPISVTGRTTLFGKLGINFGGSLDMYAQGSQGQRINTTEWKANKRPLRLTNFNFSFGYSFNDQGTVKNAEHLQTLPWALDPTGQYYERPLFQYVDFKSPWSLSFNYSFSYYDRYGSSFNDNLTQTFNFNGDISFTPKWKFGFNSGYDFKLKKLSTSSFNLHRDLHCWEFRVSWIPFGSWKSWDFGINVKSSILKDLKYNKRQSRFDNY